MRAVPALVAIAIVVAAAVFIANQAGSVAVTWRGWEIETSLAVMALAIAAVAVAASLVFTILRWLVRGPRGWSRARRERRRRDGYRALTQGLVAVAAGDTEEAQKFARKADSLLAEPPLTLLLSAQAAQLSGDEGAATHYFNAMLERTETEFLGLRGLLMQALRGGDEATALHLAERAKALRPKTPWVLSHLLELQSRARHWQAAEATLIEAAQRKVLPQADARHRHAVLLHERAAEADAEGRATEAMRLVARAHALEPAFAPVAVRYARMLAVRGQLRRARRAIEDAWRTSPHPALAEAYGTLFTGEPILQRMKHLERLAALHAGHIEGHIALATAALEARLWGEARRHLAAAQGDGTGTAPPRVCRLMADVEESEHGDHAAARAWLARTDQAASPDPAWVCDACGTEHAQWAAVCSGCRGFATMKWRGSDRPQPSRRALEGAAPSWPQLPARQ